jgi:hypothetical protein
MDKSPVALGPEECYYILNSERSLNGDGSKRGSLGKTSPMVANRPACDLDMPAGETYTDGKYYSKLTNETYDIKFNSNGVHFISRINGDGDCEIVYHNPCLSLNAAPKYSIEDWRAYLKLEKLCANQHGKHLIWVNGISEIGMLDVEASIATNSFTTPFFQRCADPCAYWQMCVPDPCGCLKGEFVPFSNADAGLSNNLLDVGVKLSYRHIYYDGRASIWADPSTEFYQDSRGCFDTSEGFPRCIKIRVPIGNPLVDRIEIAFSKNGVWYQTDTVDKYKKYNSTQQYWYQRDLAELTNYSDEDCSFDYFFCNDKQCNVIAPEEFNRVFNPMPREPQGFFPIGLKNQEDIVLAFYNYKQGNCPLDKTEVDKMDIQLSCPEVNCNIEYTKIIAYAVVHNRDKDRNQPIFRLGGDAANTPDDPADIAYFGGLNNVGGGDLELGHGQNFTGKIRNFIAYIDGTDYWDEAKQWKADPGFVAKEEWGTLAHFDDNSEKNRWRRAIRDGQYFYQKFEFTVPRGTKGFLRLASHLATGNDQNTSTFVQGIYNSISDYSGDKNLSDSNTDFTTEEIYFDTCGLETLEIQQSFVVDDNAIDAGLSTAASSYSGYIKDANSLPVEGAVVQKGGTTNTTDHNGFYHFYLYPGDSDSIDVDLLVERDCGAFSNIQTTSMTAAHGSAAIQNINITNETYRDGLYAIVKATVEDCDGNGIAGLRVSLSGSKYKITGVNGIAEFRIRNYIDRNRVVKAVLLDNGGCLEVDCSGNCSPCMPTTSSSTPACYQTKPEILLSDFVMNTDSVILNSRGLKAGGRFPFGIVVKGDCGRISAVYPVKYLDIPRTQGKNAQSFCSLTYNGNGMTLPAWGKCLEIVRGENINDFQLQWVIDKIEKTDDGKIKLTIQSLNDYNEKYFFKTNTNYQWLKGDRIEFIKNGDGKIFTIGQYGLLNYLTLSPFNDELISGNKDAPADFFNQLLIDDDGRLDALKVGAVIEIQRAKECTTEPAYFGICVSIPIVDGVLAYDSGTFYTFDTFFVNRKIGSLPLQRFEHFSPSDFWGDTVNRISDTGRPYFVNKYENEKRFGRNITINTPKEFNRFGDFVKRFDPSTHGDIIAMWLTDNRIGLCISENDNSLFNVDDDILRVYNDGSVRASQPDQIISNSEPKLRGAYGCKYESIGSIFFGDGFAMWVDVNRNCYVKHDYQQAVAVDLGKCQRYFRKRCQEIETFNRANADPLNQYRFVTGMNYQSGAIYLTIKAFRDSGINNEPGPFLKRNETIMFDPDSEDFLGFASFTPEGYSRLDLFDGAGCSYIMYLNGIPFITPVIPELWNEFFGVACDWICGISINKDERKVKRPLALEIQSETMFFVKEVRTDKANFVSEIPPVKMKRFGNKNVWNGSFLGNINSRGGLFGDEKPSGYFTQVLLIRDNTTGNIYNSISNEKRVQYSELDLVTSKFAIIEEIGVTSNL